MRLAVVGHVEWVDFVPVARLPHPGEVLHASEGALALAAGGGAVVAVQLARLGAEVSFFTALGDDDLGARAREQLVGHGIDLHVGWREQPTRRAVTLVQDSGERTIVTLGERLEPAGEDSLPWGTLAQAAAVYVTAGDAAAARAARAAALVTASPRARAALAAIEVDALIYSGRDEEEREWAQRLSDHARLRVVTEGEHGGHIEGAGRWEASPPPGPALDAYGCGDSFAAGYTFALARGADPLAAAGWGARCGVACLTGRGPYAAPLPVAA
ncbi:MAG TPA: PfkB family carbohydrate kinase [Solirubrobacteraceae bacterium]|jgi:ribokinase|nr:PfkB family carbohydrate kinase [Solirubrobacteraceae bacterium]